MRILNFGAGTNWNLYVAQCACTQAATTEIEPNIIICHRKITSWSSYKYYRAGLGDNRFMAHDIAWFSCHLNVVATIASVADEPI